MQMPCYSMFSFLFYFILFLFKGNVVRKGYLDESDFRHCMVLFFESYLITAILKFLFNNWEAHRQLSFEGHPTVEDLWTSIKIHGNSFINTLVNIMKRNEGSMKIITSFFSKNKSNPVFINILNSF